MSRLGLLCLSVASAVVIAACGSSNPPPPSDSPHPPADSGERINGSERLGWNQSVSDSAELSSLRYAAYIDGSNRAELTNVTCASPAGGSSSCSSRMPSMSPGSHTLQLVSFILDNGGSVVESTRSAELRVTLAAVTTGADPAAARALRELTTVDGMRLRVDVVTDQLESPTSLVAVDDGRVFIAERQGRIRVVSGGQLEPEPALVLDDVLVTAPSEGGLLSVAVDRGFERTRLLYVLYTTAGRDGAARFRIARFREAGGRLGERVVLLDDVAASPSSPAAWLGIGPDGKLYAAFDDGGDPERARSAAAFSGKVLRLNTDGTTPEDQPAGSPVFGSDLQSPRALDWRSPSGPLWVANTSANTEELRPIGSVGRHSAQAVPRARIPLPAQTGVASMTFYQGQLLAAFHGDLLAAASAGRHLLRLRFDPRDPTRIVATERLLQDYGGGIRVVAASPDGAVYLCTDHALLRLSPR